MGVGRPHVAFSHYHRPTQDSLTTLLGPDPYRQPVARVPTVEKSATKAYHKQRMDSLEPEIRPPPRPSLAATHPAKYRSAGVVKFDERASSSTSPNVADRRHSVQGARSTKFSPSQIGSSRRTTDLQTPSWRVYTDPMRQTHWRGVQEYRENPHVQMRSDLCHGIGNVISPVGLARLPFGGMIEVAHQYPESSKAGGDGHGMERPDMMDH